MHRVADLMAADLLTVEADARLADAVRSMDERRVGAVLVLDGDRLVGVSRNATSCARSREGSPPMQP